MSPESQTLFSVTLFLALTSLMAWTNRRNRSRTAAAGERDQESMATGLEI
jgi:hypothetical protein